MTHADHCLAQAEAAQSAADAAVLASVRDANLRSAAVWRGMADRAEAFDRMKRERSGQS